MSTHGSRHHESHHHADEQKAAPAWKRVHHSWIFWVGVVLIFVAILTYVLSMDLAWRPRVHAGAQTQPLNAVGR
jgi:hypothetical protein